MNNKLYKLHSLLKSYKSAVVAFSGGVDSSFLLKAAYDALGDKVMAVTAVSPSVQPKDLELIKEIIALIGVKHTFVKSEEFNDPRYLQNDPQRCYFCKTHIGTALITYASENGYAFILDGNNADDTSDYRPGMKAAEELGIKSPLKEAGFTKEEIRQLSKEYGLPNWDRPASPCLSSRIPYGTPIKIESLNKVDAAEEYLKTFGMKNIRVRFHNDVARIEVEPSDFNTILENNMAINATLKQIGFRYVAMDIIGFRSGSLNEVLNNG
ncbi:MAG: ATP-dependent sacrificial sulfur transferase LarE [Bacteroidales bacterium]|nr:ATP-dependent sacrificial sulfur transferase LarE [Bacteroidales bacterium]MCF8405157.1 ATP-dependent sacrificial sulfur transferase LarE [Bacteroidales bacterium]